MDSPLQRTPVSGAQGKTYADLGIGVSAQRRITMPAAQTRVTAGFVALHNKTSVTV
jgi:hypothetical protein